MLIFYVLYGLIILCFTDSQWIDVYSKYYLQQLFWNHLVIFPNQLKKGGSFEVCPFCMCPVQKILITPCSLLWIQSSAMFLSLFLIVFGVKKGQAVCSGEGFQTLPIANLFVLLAAFQSLLSSPGSGHYTYGDDEDWYSRRYKGDYKLCLTLNTHLHNVHSSKNLLATVTHSELTGREREK